MDPKDCSKLLPILEVTLKMVRGQFQPESDEFHTPELGAIRNDPWDPPEFTFKNVNLIQSVQTGNILLFKTR